MKFKSKDAFTTLIAISLITLSAFAGEPSTRTLDPACSLVERGERMYLETDSECSFHEGEKTTCAYLASSQEGGPDQSRKSTLVFRKAVPPSDYCIALKKFNLNGTPPFQGREILRSKSGALKGYLTCPKEGPPSLLIRHSNGKQVQCKYPLQESKN